MSFFNVNSYALASDVQEHDRFSVAAITTVVTYIVDCGQSVRLEAINPGHVHAAIFGRSTSRPHTIRCSFEQLNDIIRACREGAFAGVPLQYELSDGRLLTVSE